jgi:hypothetical protein
MGIKWHHRVSDARQRQVVRSFPNYTTPCKGSEPREVARAPHQWRETLALDVGGASVHLLHDHDLAQSGRVAAAGRDAVPRHSRQRPFVDLHHLPGGAPAMLSVAFYA